MKEAKINNTNMLIIHENKFYTEGKRGQGGGEGHFTLGNERSPVWEDEIWTDAWTKRENTWPTVELHPTQKEQQTQRRPWEIWPVYEGMVYV